MTPTRQPPPSPNGVVAAILAVLALIVIFAFWVIYREAQR